MELKAVKALAPEHEAQILGYLKSARFQHGLLINFGSCKFEMRKFIWEEGVTTRNTKITKKGVLGLLGTVPGLLAAH